MYGKSFRGVRWVAGVVAGLILLVFAAGVMAQGGGGVGAADVEFVGVVDSIDGQTLTVNGQAIDISRAEVNVTLGAGVLVRVEGFLLADGSILARQVNAIEAGVLPGEVEFVGILDSIDSTTLVVNGLTIDISAAEFNDNVAVGNLIKVHATLSGTGTWIAREVELFTSGNGSGQGNTTLPGEMEFVGTLSEIGTDFIVVSGQTISITGAEIHDPLVVGTLVKVHATAANGQWVAREVENVYQDDDDHGAAPALPANCSPVQPSGWTSYTVQAGDTLSSIAVRSDSSVARLTLVNCIANPRALMAGTVLFVPHTPGAFIDDSSDDHNGGSDDSSGHDSNDDSYDDSSHDDSNDDSYDDSRDDDSHDDNDDDGHDDDSRDDHS